MAIAKQQKCEDRGRDQGGRFERVKSCGVDRAYSPRSVRAPPHLNF